MGVLEDTMAANAKDQYLSESGQVDDQTEDQVEEQSEEKAEDKSEDKVEEKVEEKVEDQVEEQSEDEVEEEVEEKVEVEAEDKTEEKVEEKVEEKPVATFEEQLAEKFPGKTIAEIEAALNPKSQFANDKIKRLNELEAAGMDVTSPEFLEVQSLDIDALKNNDDILFQKWKRGEEGRGLSEETIRHEINEKYKVDEWIEKDPSEFTASDRANKEKMNRDGALGKEWLAKFKEERTLVQAVDPAIAEQEAKEAGVRQENWEKQVSTTLVDKITTLTSPISYKDEAGKTVESEFKFDISEQDRKEIGDVMKQLTKGTGAFFDQYKNEKGEPDHEALFTMMLKAKNYDRAVSLASSDAAEKRAITIERAQKNSSMKPNESAPKSEEFATMEEAQAAAFRKSRGA
jgi:hypothetical protein